MKVLFDNCMAVRFASVLGLHEVSLARSLGWHQLVNGELLRSANSAGFDFLITVDKQMQHQSSLKGLRLGVIVINVEANSHSAVEASLIALNGVLHEFEQGKFHLYNLS